MAKALGIDDAVNACDCCGKTGLKYTVVIELDSGELAHYGQVCATRNTGKPRTQLNQEIKQEEAARLAQAIAEYRGSPQYQAQEARFKERDALGKAQGQALLGRVAADFVRNEVRAASQAREAIASKHRVCHCNPLS